MNMRDIEKQKKIDITTNKLVAASSRIYEVEREIKKLQDKKDKILIEHRRWHDFLTYLMHSE